MEQVLLEEKYNQERDTRHRSSNSKENFIRNGKGGSRNKRRKKNYLIFMISIVVESFSNQCTPDQLRVTMLDL